MKTLSIDFETRATVNLKKTGVYPYAEHPHTDIWCMAWAFDDDEPVIWTPGMELPREIVDHIIADGEIRAWNAQFERVIWKHIMVPRYGAPVVKLEQWVCTMAEANAMSLPGSLDQAAIALGLKERKDTEGYGLMMRMTKPRSLQADGTPIWWDVEDRKQRLYAYCKQDVIVERAAKKCLHRLPPRERDAYLLVQEANDYGIALDLPLIDAAQALVDEGIARANATLAELTGGEVTKVTQTQQIKNWMGTPEQSLAKAAVADLLESSDLDPQIRQVLGVRAEAGLASVKKLKAMKHYACADGRARGLIFYHGATTGRETAKGIQPHNFARGHVTDVESFIPDVLANRYDVINMLEHPIVVVSALLRSMLTAATKYPEVAMTDIRVRDGHTTRYYTPTHALYSGDFSAIEARVVNWLAGETEIVADFHRFDAAVVAHGKSSGEAKALDLYIRMAKRFGSTNRQAGKAAELGCGFGMGWKKFITAAWDVYQVRVTEEEARHAVNAYRESHPNVKEFWYEVGNAAIAATETPGRQIRVGALKNITIVRMKDYLYIVLPAKRALVYPAPRITMALPPWVEEDEPEEQKERQKRKTLTYMGLSLNNQWERQRTYGGHLVENIVQAVARDFMVEAKARARAAGYANLLSVHDEVVTERVLGEGSLDEYIRLMSVVPDWATGCPVAVEAWTGFRYRK